MNQIKTKKYIMHLLMYGPLVFSISVICVFGPFIIGSDPTDVTITNAKKINHVVANLQTNSRHRGSSAAESQGIDIRINYIFRWATGLSRPFCHMTS